MRTLAGPVGLAVILGIVFVAYARILDDWFTSDDFWYLRAAQTATYPDYIQNAFDFTRDGPVPEFLYRPLYVAIFPVFYFLFGLEAWAYHLLGLAVHMANTGLVWLIARRLSGRLAVAHSAAFLFGLHPTYAPAVAWITNNVAVFAMCSSLSSLLLFLTYLEGGRRRQALYGASFVAMVVAMLLHPEAVVLPLILVLSFFLLYAKGLEKGPSLRTWWFLVPHLYVGMGIFVVQLWAGQYSDFEVTSFSFGSHLFENFFQYLALAGNPFGTDLAHLEHWRTLIPLVGVVLVSVYLLAVERRRRPVVVLLLVWFYLTVVVLASPSTFDARPRKLYAAGPPLAMILALAGVSLWDWLAARGISPSTRRDRPRPLRRRGSWLPTPRSPYSRAPALLLALAVAALVALPWRTSQVVEPENLAKWTHSGGVSSERYKAIVKKVRETHPVVPQGGRLELVGRSVPIVFGVLNPKLVDAIQVYYDDDVAVIGAKTPEDIRRYPPLPASRRLTVFFE